MENKDNQTQNTQPVIKTPKSHTGPVLGILVVVVVLILAAFYLWGSMLSEDTEKVVENTTGQMYSEEDMEAVGSTSDSDEIADIEADILDTNVDIIDDSIADIEAEYDTVE